MADTNTPFLQRVAELRGDLGWSGERLAYEAADPDTDGLKLGTIRKAIDGRRTLTPLVMGAIADALGVPADTFPEYRLAVARQMFDERVHGLDGALENLSLLERALSAAGARAAETEAAPASDQERHLRPAASASPPKGRDAS